MSESHLVKFHSHPDRPSPRAVLFLAGFPAFGGRNEDLAKSLSPVLSADCYVLHYPGLGLGRDTFTFSSALGSARETLESLETTHQAVAVVGHSFGGWLALQVCGGQKSLRSVTLLSPLLELPPASERVQIIRDFAAEQRKRGAATDEGALLSEMLGLDQYRSTHQAARGLIDEGIRLSLVQAVDDQVTPTALARAWAAGVSDGLAYSETPGDHWWSGQREALAGHILGLQLF